MNPKESEATWARHEKSHPKCPKCGRRYAEKFHKPRSQKLSYRCVGVPVNPGCGKVWDQT
jgi:transposase-like protein